MKAEILRRAADQSSQLNPEAVAGLDKAIHLQSIDLFLPVAEIYRETQRAAREA